MTRYLPRRALPLLLSLTGLAGCSLLNSFPDENPDGGTGGSPASGGMGGSSTGGVATGGGGGEPSVEVDPGLVVVSGFLDGELTSPTLLALSPYTGTELARIPGEFAAVAHEAERDLWFLVEGTELRAARFDLADNRWVFEGEEAVVPLPIDPAHVFALNGTLSILRGDGKLDVFDTSNVEEIRFVGSVDYPLGLWGATGLPTRADGGGGFVFALYLDCGTVDTDPCVVRNRRIRVSGSEDQLSFQDTTIATFTVRPGAALGGITTDPSAGTPVAVVPDLRGDAPGENPLSTAWVLGTNGQPSDSFELPQTSNKPRSVVVDPCQGVVYVMVPEVAPLVGIGMTNDPTKEVMSKAVNMNGQGMTFEPYTRTLLLQQQTGDFRLDAWRINGTQLAPDLRKRLNDWETPSIRPRFVTVATPRTPVCPE